MKIVGKGAVAENTSEVIMTTMSTRSMHHNPYPRSNAVW